jgi:hypothetical protein
MREFKDSLSGMTEDHDDDHPVVRSEVTAAPAHRFDPITGEPLNAEPAHRFDPITGEPLTDDARSERESAITAE